MNAVRIHGRGGPEFLAHKDAPIRQYDAGEALVRVHATGITPAELGEEKTHKSRDPFEAVHKMMNNHEL